MFKLPNELEQYDKNKSILFYFYENSLATRNSKIYFTQFCISIGICGRKKLGGQEGIEEFSKGDIILYRPGNFIGYENIDDTHSYKSLMIFFNEKMVLDIFSILDNSSDPSKEILPIRPFYSFKSDAYLNTYLKSIIDHLKNRTVFNPTLQKSKLLELFMYLQAINKADLTYLLKVNLQYHSDAKLERIVESYNIEQFTLDELAFMCNMSLSTFKRVFLKKYGINPGKWLSNRRFQKIAEQIKLYSKPPFEVFVNSGYKDYSSFSHAFKKQFGCSPKNYAEK